MSSRFGLVTVLMCAVLAAMAGCMNTDTYAPSHNPLTPAVGGAATKLPITDFTNAQGSTNVFFPPDPDLIAWSGRPPDYPYLGWMDYAGAANRYLVSIGYPSLGTRTSGSFTRRDVGDGIVEYSVELDAANALAWCVSLAPDFTLTDLLGAHGYEVAAGATPALGRCHLSATWRQDAGTPIADLCASTNVDPDLYAPPGFQVVSFSFRGQAFGPLHEAANMGAEGTPGVMIISQTESNLQSVGHGVGNGDAYPAEIMDLHPVGSGSGHGSTVH